MAASPLIVDEKVIALPGGSGGKSVIACNRMTGDPLWQNKRMKNKFASSVLHEGFIHGLDEAILACIDASTGELRWKDPSDNRRRPVLAGHQP